jgi:hypothetical protein
MPVLLDKADIEPWLSGAGGAELLRSAAEDCLRMWPVFRRVKKTGSGDDDPTLIEEVGGVDDPSCVCSALHMTR